MPPNVHRLLSLGILWLHLMAMALLLGGALLLWWLARPQDEAASAFLLSAARRYERLFWAAVGLGVMTGVGNLGTLAAHLPGRDSDWGGVLTVKLVLVTLGAMLSVVRTLLVTQLTPAGARQRLCWAYGGTAAGIAVVAGLGVYLAGD